MWNTIILEPMVNVLIWIYNLLFHNFGLAIIVFTIVIRLITYPLTAQQLKSQSKMQELQQSKKWQEIQKKYKDDKQKLSQEQMNIYKEMGINPLGSCSAIDHPVPNHDRAVPIHLASHGSRTYPVVKPKPITLFIYTSFQADTIKQHILMVEPRFTRDKQLDI